MILQNAALMAEETKTDFCCGALAMKMMALGWLQQDQRYYPVHSSFFHVADATSGVLQLHLPLKNMKRSPAQ